MFHSFSSILHVNKNPENNHETKAGVNLRIIQMMVSVSVANILQFGKNIMLHYMDMNTTFFLLFHNFIKIVHM